MDLIDEARKLQEAYWQPSATEQAELASKGVDALSWPQLFRLHHLTCMELAETSPALADPDEEADLPDSPGKSLCAQTLARLVSKESPYRERPLLVWQGKPGG